jgi:hypothetical protein
MKLGMKEMAMKYLIVTSLTLILLILTGCNKSQLSRGEFPLSIVEPANGNECLDDIPSVRYKVKATNGAGEEETLEFNWPWYTAIGGKIGNESGVFDRAPAGQIDQSTVLGVGTRKYFLWSAHRAKNIRVAFRDPTDWTEIKKMLLEVGGKENLLPLTALPPEVIEKEVWGKNIPPELFVSGTLTEVTVGEESSAAGLYIAGFGASKKIVRTSVSGSIEITDPYTGELLISIMGQNRVTASQVGFEVSRIVSAFGGEEYVHAEIVSAKEMIKQQVQVELVDFLFYKAFKELFESRPEYFTQRLHYRAGVIRAYAERIATAKGLTIVGNVVPVQAADKQAVNSKTVEIKTGVPFIRKETLATFYISGTATCKGLPLSGVVMKGLPREPVTDAKGKYIARVGYGFGGEVTPTKEGYIFEPATDTYTKVTTNQRRDYTAKLLTYTISGSTGISGVVMKGLPGEPVTDDESEYSAIVEYGYSGEVTPTKEGYIFEPGKETYTKVTADQSRNYTAKLLTHTIRGSTGISGMVMKRLPKEPVTDDKGEYIASIDYGFSREVKPTKETYTKVTSNPQFEEIEKYIARLHQGIENYYTNQLIEVKQRVEAEIKLLEVADKPVYAGLAGQAEVAKTVLHINNYGYRAPWYLESETERMLQLKDDFDEYKLYGDFADSIKNSPKRFAVAQSRIAERKSDILTKLAYETADLERGKNYALTITLPKLEKQLKQDLLTPEPKPTHGMVTGIVYSADKPSAIIDHKIVHEGDVIHGATVVKIYRDSVKFSKKNKNWEQKVQQAPEAYW